jgi:hypothetical protein
MMTPRLGIRRRPIRRFGGGGRARRPSPSLRMPNYCFRSNRCVGIPLEPLFPLFSLFFPLSLALGLCWKLHANGFLSCTQVPVTFII